MIVFCLATLFLLFCGQHNASGSCKPADTTYVHKDTLVKVHLCYPYGMPRITIPYRNGRLHGLQKMWHENGKLAGTVEYKEGVRHGKRIGLSEEGDTVLSATYHLGKPVDTLRVWYTNLNRKKIEVFDSAGERHALFLTWREDGTRKDSMVFDHGEVLEAREYFEDGTVRYHRKREDEKVIWAEHFSPLGKTAGTVRNGNGKVILYSEDGKEAWLLEYVNGNEVNSRKLEPGEKPRLE